MKDLLGKFTECVIKSEEINQKLLETTVEMVKQDSDSRPFDSPAYIIGPAYFIANLLKIIADTKNAPLTKLSGQFIRLFQGKIDIILEEKDAK